MNIISFVIRRKTLVSMLFIGLCLLGIISYRSLPVELIPLAEPPILIVSVNASQELDPSYIEKEAVIPIEGAIGTLENIDQITANVNARRAMITIEYHPNANIKFAYLRLTEAINNLRNSLPEEFFVSVFKIDTEQLSNTMMVIQARGSGGADRVRQIVDEKITDELLNIDGIASVDIAGGRQKTVEIILNEAACEAQSITPAQIRTAINRQEHAKSFVGYAYEKGRKHFVNFSNEFASVSNLENIILKTSGPVRLKDVADIFVGVREPETISRINGKETVTLTLIRDSQANLISVANFVRQQIETLNKKLENDDVNLVIQTDSAEVMEDNIDMIVELGVIGGLLAIVVLWYFLQNLRLVFIVALAIPISILVSFNFFYMYGISINSLTLVGIALAIGMLLDNSVVVLENIYRLLSQKKPLETAIVQGTREVGRSIFAATLTTITVFLPFMFTDNFLIKLMGKHVSVSIISTLVISLAVALLLIPMLAHKILSRTRTPETYRFNIVSQNNRFVQIYTLFLKFSMRYPARTIIGAIVLFFGTLLLAFTVSISSQQDVESNQLDLYVTMAKGATLDKTDAVVSDLEQRLKDIAEIKDVVTKIYEDEATVNLQLVDHPEKIDDRDIQGVKSLVQEKLRTFRAAAVSFDAPESSHRFGGGGRGGGARGQQGFMSLLGVGGTSERVTIKGHDLVKMRSLADDIKSLMSDNENISNVSLNISDNQPELHLLFDRSAFDYYNITLTDVASELIAFSKETTSGSSFKIGNEEYDIVIKNEVLTDKTSDDLRQIRIPTAAGGEVDLEKISTLLFTSGPSDIVRVNQEKQIELMFRFLEEVNNSTDLLKNARLEVDNIIDSFEIPDGIAVEVIHDETDYSEFQFLIGAAFLLIYMILAAVFESFSLPFVMMFTIPLAAIGSILAIILTGNSLLNANTLIGLLILLGVVVNNGIILIDYTRILRQRGYRMERALIAAGQARVRPILITAITTIVALFPLAMGQGEYVATIGAPFAITVIGGLAFSAFFTLIFIPTTYAGLENALLWWEKQSLLSKIIQLTLFVTGAVLIYLNLDSLLWKIINITLLIIAIPALTYFFQTSLRTATADIIPDGQPLHIQLKHLVKIYDSDSRFVREWKAGARIATKSRVEQTDSRNWWLQQLAWQVPVIGFLTYFIYFYLDNHFWQMVLAVYLYLLLITMIRPRGSIASIIPEKTAAWAFKILTFAFPALTVVLFYFQWNSLSSPLVIAALWYLAIAVRITAQNLVSHRKNIDGLTGRFAGIRRLWYLFVNSIPLIGRQKEPFSALKGVTLEIGNGMFGLLGPNGAGKTTMMRAICGILEPNRGAITINGIYLDKKREELQGLIGYLPQEFGTYENMSAVEFLGYQAMLKGIWEPEERETIVQKVLHQVHLEEKQHIRIGAFSGGMRQRVGIAQTLLHLPRILVVDEPTAGLDPRERIRFRNLLVELSRERIVIFSTHIIEDISSSCNSLAVLNRGEVKYLGAPEAMVSQVQGNVWQAYLSPDEFEKIRHELHVVHHMRDGKKIRVRCLSITKPLPTAETVIPTLEDAYLWLISQ